MEAKTAAAVWGPKYWFFLHSIAHIYSDFPTETLKRKYYDLIINFPVFIPNLNMADQFAKMLDEFPVTPYLRNKESLIRWVFFMHNKINKILGKHSPLSFENAQEEFLSKFEKKEATRVLAQNESFPAAWARRNKKITILLILFAVALLLAQNTAKIS